MKQAKLFGNTETEPKVLSSIELAKAKVLASQICDQMKALCIRLELRPKAGFGRHFKGKCYSCGHEQVI